MAQARRIKPKVSKAKKTSKKISLLNLPWGLMFVILISGVVLGMLFSGVNSGDKQLGAGLKQLFKTNKSVVVSDATIAASKVTKPVEKEFDFYELLPEIEKVMPNNLTDTNPTRAVDNVDYYLQAASFINSADAETFRAELALKGFKSIIQSQVVEGKGKYYRVRLGPYENKRVAKTVKNKLQKEGIEPFVFSVKK